MTDEVVITFVDVLPAARRERRSAKAMVGSGFFTAEDVANRCSDRHRRLRETWQVEGRGRYAAERERTAA